MVVAFEERFASARAEWPLIECDREEFARHVGSKIEGCSDPLELLSGLHLGDLYLAWTASRLIPAALSAFDAHFLTRVVSHLSDRDLATDIKQQIRCKLFVNPSGSPSKLLQYSGRGRLVRWLQIIANRVEVDLYRERKGMVETELELEALVVEDDIEVRYFKGLYAEQISAAFRRALLRLPTKDRLMLRLSVVDDATEEEIGRILRVHKSTVSRHLAGVRRALLASLRAHLKESLGMITLDGDSFMRLLQSQITMGVCEMLAAQE